MEKIGNLIKSKKIGKVVLDATLKKYTTYKIGGIARVICYPENSEKLIELIKLLRENDIKYMILGCGSNVIFSDKDYEGVIIKLDEMNKIEFSGNKVIAEAGASLILLANLSVNKGYSGLEFATGIPGSVGGAVYMNAGAYKGDMGYVVSKVKVLTPDLKVITMVNSELDFHYRSSFFQKNKGYICLEATIKLKKGNKDEILEIVKERRKRRIESQPLEYPSAGSVFRNPEGDYAGRLIEELGFKGLVKGGAQVSEKHANFVVNINNATGKDVRDLILFIKDQVKEKYDIDLKVEQEFVNWE